MRQHRLQQQAATRSKTRTECSKCLENIFAENQQRQQQQLRQQQQRGNQQCLQRGKGNGNGCVR